MQPGRARTTGLGVPPLLLAWWVSWVAPVHPTHGVLVPSRSSAALGVHVCAVSWATWLLFTCVTARCVVLRVRCPGPRGSCSQVCSLCALRSVCGVLGHLAPVHRCSHSVCCVARSVSWPTWLLFTGVHAWFVVSPVRCPGPLGSCSPVCPLGMLCCACGLLGHLALVHRCACLVVVSHVRCPVPLVSCSPVSPLGVLCCMRGGLGHLAPVHRCVLGVLCCVCGVLGHLAPVQQCDCPGRCFASAVSWATWLLFTVVLARCVVSHVRCPGQLGSRSLVCPLGVLCRVCGVPGHLAPCQLCARLFGCVASAVSWANWLLFTGLPARCVVMRLWCPGPLGSYSPVCAIRLLLCLCAVLGHLAPVHQCARLVCSVACAVSSATWPLFTGVHARCVALRVRCPGTLGSCSPVCPLDALRCVCAALGHLAPVHQLARSVWCVVCAVSWATWLLFTIVPARCGLLRVRCPGALGSCSPVCPLVLVCCVYSVVGHLAPVHRCAPSVRCFACAVSWATWPLFIVAPAQCVSLHVQCPGPLGSCSPLCALRPLLSLCGVPGHLAPVHRCARRVRSVACGVSWGTWLLFTGVPARCVALRVRCPGPLGSCSPVYPLLVLCGVSGVLGHVVAVHRRARLVCFF